MAKFMKLNDIGAYTISFHLSSYVWDIVVRWDSFERYSIGEQFVKAIDSVSANIAEGFGRYTKKDKIKFYRYSQGSLMESFDWTEKARIRKLLTYEQYNHIHSELKKMPIEINYLIQFTNERLKV